MFSLVQTDFQRVVLFSFSKGSNSINEYRACVTAFATRISLVNILQK